MAQFNANDPRYLREIQRLAAQQSMGGRRGLMRPAIGQVAGQHAGHQLERGLTFQRLGLASKMAEQQHELALARSQQVDRGLDMSEKRLAFSTSKASDRLKADKKALNFSIASGLAGLGMSAYEARRRNKISAADRKERRDFMDKYKRHIQNARFNAIPEPVFNAIEYTSKDSTFGLGGS